MATEVRLVTHIHSSSLPYRKQVIKIGTSSLINPDSSSLNLRALAGLSETVRVLKDAGHDVVLVSSGAVGVGCQRLGLLEKPQEVCKRQALAAVGQVHLMRFYDDLFSACGLVRILSTNVCVL